MSEGDNKEFQPTAPRDTAQAPSSDQPTPGASVVQDVVPAETSADTSVLPVGPDSAAARTNTQESDWPTSLQSLMVTVVIAAFVITFIVQAFQIPSESMENTLLIGDYLLVDKSHYGPGGIWKRVLPYRDIRRGDIVVFRYPIHPSQHFVKRVIGVPGDRIRMIRGKVYVNREPIWEPYAVHNYRGSDDYRDNFPTGQYLSPSVEARWYLQLHKLVEDGQLIVPADCYFVLGDNRDDSLDSRYWGFVPRENIIGTPLLIYWSMQRPDLDDPELAQNGKLARFGRVLTTMVQNMRWKRMMRLVH